MKDFVKFLGLMEEIGAIVVFVFFFISLADDVFSGVLLALAISLLINGSVFFFIGDLGDKVEALDRAIKANGGKIELLHRNRVNDRVEELEKKIRKLEAKLQEANE